MEEKKEEVQNHTKPEDDNHRNLHIESRCKSLEECDDRPQDELIHSPTAKNVKAYNNDKAFPLYTIDNVPEYLGDNKYIITGYRAYYSTIQCIKSITHLHNETFNIWTHLAGGLIFTGLIFYLFHCILIPEYIDGNVMTVRVIDENESLNNSILALNKSSDNNKISKYLNKIGISRNNNTFDNKLNLTDKMYNVSVLDNIQHHKVLKVHVSGERTAWPFILFGVYSAGCVGCMLCSASYHIFTAHISERWYHIAHKLDYFGITLLIVGSFIPFSFYTLECEPFWRNVYTGMILVFGFIGMLGPFFRHWTSTSFALKKNLFYVCMVGSGLFPITHIFFLPNKIGLPYVSGLLIMLFLYGVGVFIYIFKIPELFYPGKFDIYFSSHQIFHIFVLAAALTHFFNCIDMYVHYDQMICAHYEYGLLH